ncbi:MAG: dockerin type I repeat-containing protein, partial [Oscillospiraceae bacterium]|nr:dockerin type I repeat-containing protein [Oscillospiraceae bacterium]
MLDWINVVIFAITMSFSSQTGELPVDVDKVIENIETAPFYDVAVTPSENDDTLVGRITDWVSANMNEFEADETDTSANATNYQTITVADTSDTGAGMFALANPRILTTSQYNAMVRAIPQNLIYSDALEIVIGIEPRTKSSFLKAANAEITSIRTPAGAELLDDEYVATGDYLTKSGSAILYRVVIFGDVDFDGMVTSADAELIKRGYEETITLTPPALYAANVDWSGQDSITPLDYDIVRDYILNQKPIKQDHDVDFTSTQPEYAGEHLTGDELNAYKRMIKNYQNMDKTADYSQFNLTEAQFNKVYGSFFADFPELIWFANTPTVNLSNGAVSIVEFNYKYTPFEKDSMVLEIEAVQNSFLEGIDKYDNDYERYKFIHNKIITSCAYNLESLTYTNPSEFKNEGDIYGALVQKSPSNEGYSRAFQYICKLAGLECLYVVGDKEIT